MLAFNEPTSRHTGIRLSFSIYTLFPRSWANFLSISFSAYPISSFVPSNTMPLFIWILTTSRCFPAFLSSLFCIGISFARLHRRKFITRINSDQMVGVYPLRISCGRHLQWHQMQESKCPIYYFILTKMYPKSGMFCYFITS